MDFWTFIQVLILGAVEGLTEFLPISSTGHQIIVADLLDFGGERAMAFNIIIQLGAILAVVWEFRPKIIDIVKGLPSQRNAQRFTLNLLIAFLPAVVLGVLFADKIHQSLFNPITVAMALVVGGIVIMNVMLVSVSERTREIGVRRALGATQQDILTQFLTESLIQCIIGGIFGISIGFACASALRNFTSFPADVQLWVAILGVILSSVIGLFFGIYPARKAAQLDPVTALRKET
jgi:undecaprenyl pyrophosphate phosphatase UppP